MILNPRKKLLFVGLDFAHRHYFSQHKVVLRDCYDLGEVRFDKDPFISRFFRRRSFFSLPIELVYFFILVFWVRPSVIISAGPKVGFLTSIVGFFFKNTVVIHWFTGQVWATKIKFRYSSAYWVDWVIKKLADHTICDGPSQQEFINLHLPGRRPTRVLMPGSINGIDARYFNVQRRETFHKTLRLCYVGRKAAEKGIETIVSVASECAKLGMDVHFTLAGPRDLSFVGYDAFKRQSIVSVGRLEFVDEYVDPVEIFKDHDVFVLLSYREGFSGTVVQAQAAGLPVICSGIYGLTDTFIDGVTGYKVNPNDVVAVVSAIQKLEIREKREVMSRAARQFASNFRDEKIRSSIEASYREMGILN